MKGEKQENGFNRRVEEIERTIPKSKTPVFAIVEIESKRYFKKKKKKSRFDFDSKSALRIGFARQGRLTQFINTPSKRSIHYLMLHILLFLIRYDN